MIAPPSDAECIPMEDVEIEIDETQVLLPELRDRRGCTRDILERGSDETDRDCDLHGVTAAEYVTLSSYGEDGDMYCSSASVTPDGQPIFTRRVWLFFVTTFLARPICCAAFLTYGRFTDDYRLFDTCLATTLFFYALLVLEACLMYANVRADKMPLGRTERCVVAVLEIACPAAFICASSAIIFYDNTFFARAVQYPRTARYGDSIDLLTGAMVLSHLIYSVLSISDAMAFVAPRVWTVAITKSGIPF